MPSAEGASSPPETPLKRKRDETDEILLDRRPFTIRSNESSPVSHSLNLVPCVLLPRVQLPLAYLDTSSSGPRTFSAYLNVLECNDSCKPEATILIGLEQTEQRLYAIERVSQRKYALCALGDWVSVSDVQKCSGCRVSANELPSKRQAIKQVTGGNQPWWASACVDVPTTLLLSAPMTAVCSSALPHAKTQSPKLSANGTPSPAAEVQELALDRPPHLMQTKPSQQKSNLSPANTLQELAKYYLEALYLSRTSLAYFSKGPLSRARAAATGDNADIPAIELCTFLRDAILTSPIMDNKYRDGLNDMIKATLVDGSPQTTKRKKKRKWKAKRDKGGCFVDENEYIEKWWSDLDDAAPASGITQSVDDALRRRIPNLRQRETFLQIILVLEALALEGALPMQAEPRTESESNGTEPGKGNSNITHVGLTDAQKSKPKRKTDLPSLLETLIDKLCIWHSLDSSSPAKKPESEHQTAQDTGNDNLRNFCVEVIIPFYMPRIPQYATIVNKKLGGPTAPTPVKRKSSTAGKPGAPAVRNAPAKERRATATVPSNSRAASFDDRLSQSTRSDNISGAHPRIKRETSEIPLASIPLVAPSKPAPRQRTSLLHSMSFSKREVDLSAMSQASEAKMRKKADIQAKMQEAISNIKKPNRALATKDIADTTDESFARATAKPRHSDSRRPKATQQSVQVTATPKHVRASKATPYRRPMPVDHSSGLLHVTSSTSKPQVQLGSCATSAIPSTGHRARHDTAQIDFAETPSRGFSKYIPAGLAHMPGTLDSSPIATRKTFSTAVQQTPSRPIRTLELLPPTLSRSVNPSSSSNQALRNVAATPLRSSTSKIADAPLVEASPNPTRASGQHHHVSTNSEVEEKSVYASLGWDDEEDYEQLA